MCDALTTSVDLHATLADVFGVAPAHRTHGVSLRPLLDSRPPSPGTGREWAIGGVWGNWVQVTDGRRKYARAPVEGNRPLAVWSNRWSTMPLHMAGVVEMPPPDARAGLAFMPGSTVPVIRQPYGPGDPLPFWGLTRRARHHLYDVDVDPDEAENRADEPRAAKEMLDLLHTALESVEAPPEQYERLGLA